VASRGVAPGLGRPGESGPLAAGPRPRLAGVLGPGPGPSRWASESVGLRLPLAVGPVASWLHMINGPLAFGLNRSRIEVEWSDNVPLPFVTGSMRRFLSESLTSRYLRAYLLRFLFI
jgi:hypothetical protein